MFTPVTTLALGLALSSSVAATPPVNLAQSTEPYSDWTYLYSDSFETNQGTEVTQNWWLDPDMDRMGATVRFNLLSRRSPASDNGTAAGVFGYILNCDALSYALETADLLDRDDEVVATQTYQTALRPADDESAIYPHLQNICDGAYD